MSLFGPDDPEPVEVLDKPLTCQVCQHGTFYTRKAQLHSGMATFFNVEWTSPTCTCVICSKCGFVHWFFPEE